MAKIKAINLLPLLIKQEDPRLELYSIPPDEYWGHNDYRINLIQRIIDEDNNVVILLISDCAEVSVLEDDMLDIDVYKLVLTHPF